MRTLRPNIANLARWVETAVIVALVILLAIACVVMFGFLAADLATKAGTATPSWGTWVRDLSLRIAGQDPQKLSGEPLARIVSTVLSFTLAFVSVWFGVLTSLAYRRYRRDVKRAAEESAIVETYPVGTVGVDDLKTMYDFYYKGDQITVFSGDFDWILKHKKLRALIETLADNDKILLVSYKTPGKIEAAWDGTAKQNLKEGVTPDEAKTLLSKLKPRFRFHERTVKFTLIDIGQGQESFLSLVKARPGIGKDANIGIHSDKGAHATSLLRILKNIGEVDKCEGLRNWDKQLNHEASTPNAH